MDDGFALHAAEPVVLVAQSAAIVAHAGTDTMFASTAALCDTAGPCSAAYSIQLASHLKLFYNYLFLLQVTVIDS